MKRSSIIISYISGGVLIVFLFWAYKTNKNEQILLRENGIITTGVIIKLVDRKRWLDFMYQFKVNDKIYKSWEKTYKTVGLGDTIEVKYYSNNPSINKPVFEIK